MIVFGFSNVTVLNTSHIGVVNETFTMNLNSDNRSDLIEWMLSQ